MCKLYFIAPFCSACTAEYSCSILFHEQRVRKTEISLVMETPDAALFPAFFLCFLIFLLSLFSCFQLKKTLKNTERFFCTQCVTVGVCFTVLCVVVCVSGPCISDSKGTERSPQAIQSDLIKRE